MSPRAGAASHAEASEGNDEATDELDCTVRLSEALDLAAAAPLARELLARRGKSTVVDAAAAARPGAQCLQVLLAATRSWERDGVPFTVVNCGPQFIEHLQLLGIDPAPFHRGVQP